MKKILIGSFYAMLLIWSNSSIAQTLSADSTALATTSGSLSQRYAQGLGFESRLYSGPEYVNYVKRYVTGHQFFESSEPQPAIVEYGGSTYTNVPLRYDLIRDLLVLQSPLGALNMQLVNEHVARFTIDEHTFIRLVADSSKDSPVSTGFYDLLVEGPTRVLAARRKSIQERSVAEGMVGEISQRDELFVFTGNRYYRVSSARAVLNLFPENKAALRKYIRTQKLKFSATQREATIAALVRYQATLRGTASPAN
jgi:hypothetical protein